MTHKLLSFIFVITQIICSCTPRYQIEEKYDHIIIHQNKGTSIGVSCWPSPTIEQNNLLFKDLNRNGKLDPYEDWRLASEERARNLSSMISVEDIFGLMLYEVAVPTMPVTDDLCSEVSIKGIRNILAMSTGNTKVHSIWSNAVQKISSDKRFGIPVNIASDPRNQAIDKYEYHKGQSGVISYWPSFLGVAATFDPSVAYKYGEIASMEYRQLGITTALSPQVDISSEPRWSRFVDTFGEDVRLVSDLSSAFVRGLQTSAGECEISDGWGYQSVNSMLKHWPGGGCGESGRDAHFAYGKYEVYPGNQFSSHLQPFVSAISGDGSSVQIASSIMPYYSVPYNQDIRNGENVGNSYSSFVINELLRDKYGFDGVVCTDWGIIDDNNTMTSFASACWGVEELSIPERFLKLIVAGVDQFGGTILVDSLRKAYDIGSGRYGVEFMDKRLRESARRILKNMFQLGLFENPYTDYQESLRVVGNEEFMECGYNAQLKSIVMLKNKGKALPLNESTKIYIPKVWIEPRESVVPFFNSDNPPKGHWEYPINIDLVNRYFQVVDNPDDADVALVLIDSPYSGEGYDSRDVKTGGNGYLPISLQYNDYTATYARETSIAGGDPLENFTNRSYKGKTTHTKNKQDLDVVLNTRELMGNKPIIVQIDADRPFIVSEFENVTDALLIGFGVQKQAFLDIISGKTEPSGLLPMQMPNNMRTVEEQFEDVSHDMDCYIDSEGNTYDFAFGLNWDGIINDDRVKRYKMHSE